MLETIITVGIVGLLVGFFFSVPVAGPISILITSHSLKNERRYAMLAASGAAIVDFIYCFIAVFGFTKLFIMYGALIPYIMILGAVFIVFVGIRIYRSKIDLEHVDDQTSTTIRIRKIEKKHNGFWTGFLLNLLNPTLFIGWLTASFICMSFAATLGFNVGGLESVLGENVETINGQSNHMLTVPDNLLLQNETEVSAGRSAVNAPPGRYQLLYNISYALAVALGTIIWFYYFSGFLKTHRKKIDTEIINRIIKGLGIVLFGFGIYLVISSVKIFIS